MPLRQPGQAPQPDESARRSRYEVPASLLEARAWTMKGSVRQARHAYEGALATLEKALRTRPNDPTLRGALGLAEAGLGRKRAAIQSGTKATQSVPLSRDAFYGSAHLAVLAEIYAQTGDANRTVKLLRRLLSMPAGGVISVQLLRLDPIWDPVRRDPRFQALLKSST